MVSHDTCGVPTTNGDSSDMKLQATETQQSVASNAMKYREGRPTVREYDSCYYEVGAQNLTELGLTSTKSSEPRIFF